LKLHLTWLIGILRRIGILLLLYFCCRILFLLHNHSLFPPIYPVELISIFGAGIIFDVSALLLLNSVYILFSLIPFKFRHRKGYTHFLRHLFLWPNALALLLNLADITYYPFTLKRTTFDIFQFVGNESAFFSLLPSFLLDYWYLFLLLILFVWTLWYLEKRSVARPPGEISLSRYTGIHSLILILSIPAFTVLYRGGLQLKPIHLMDAGRYTEPKYIPLVLNTTFTVLKTIGSGNITQRSYFSKEDCNKLFNPVISPDSAQFRQKNIVIIILESFSKEYSAFFSGTDGYTPFLDSLAAKGIAFTNAFANGHRSIEALPAIISGLPSLMDEPYITSTYAGNTLNSLPILLEKKGYSSSFFHGARNGSMGFDSYAKIAGFDQYYGKNEYANDADADGHWGIWDRPFFRFFSKKLSEQKEPFFSTIFTLSSHHPFNLPANERFLEGTQEIHKTIAYTDDVLKEFFYANRNTSWFKNTLFVIVADHTGPDDPGMVRSKTSPYEIPIVIYDPSDSISLKVGRVTQQADIMATVFQKIGYDAPFYSFGGSAFGEQGNFACWQANGMYTFLIDSFIYEFDGENTFIISGLGNKVTLADVAPEKHLQFERFIKAYIQRYNHDMIHNELRIK